MICITGEAYGRVGEFLVGQRYYSGVIFVGEYQKLKTIDKSEFRGEFYG